MEDNDDIGVSNIGKGRRRGRGVCCASLMCHNIRRTPFAVSVRTSGEVRSEIGILIACAILLAEIKAGALIELTLMAI